MRRAVKLCALVVMLAVLLAGLAAPAVAQNLVIDLGKYPGRLNLVKIYIDGKEAVLNQVRQVTYYGVCKLRLLRDGQQVYRPVAVLQPLPSPADVSPAQGQGQRQVVAGLSADEQKMLELVNRARRENGVPELRVNMDLVRVARLKARDMIENNYFGHVSPIYGSPFEMMSSFGISYRTAGENLAGAPDVTVAHENLMKSPGHRRNILNPNFTEVGIGVVNGGPYGKMFVQLFKG